MYRNGEGVERDYAKAVEWYEKSAEGGDTVAMICLGDLYENGGYGVEQDYEKAEEWYRKGAERYRKTAEAGSDSAMASLGECYIDGKGVTADSEEALRWFTKSLEAGFQYPYVTYINKAVQGTLNSLGYGCGSPDGEADENDLIDLELDEKTRNAVRSFRRDYGMADSDLIDLELMKKILEVAENS